MDLSIVIVNWNTRDLLYHCLRSIQRAEHALRLEIMVVDNASSDGSIDMVLRNFPDVKLLQNTENLGFARANNIALVRAAGRYVLLLNTDTLVHGKVLQNAIAWLDEQPDVGVMGPRLLNADASIQPSCGMFPSIRNLTLQTLGITRIAQWDGYRMTGWSHSYTRDVEVISGAAMFVRRGALKTVGLLDEEFFFFGEETDWCRRFAKSGWRVVFNPIPDITHFGGGSALRLEHTRDIMLTEAMTRLHHKHFGYLTAVLCFFILAVHNLSRAVLWSFLSIMRIHGATGRAAHFLKVSANLQRAWPAVE